MEDRRKRPRSRSGIQLHAALVLVSVGANPFFDRDNARLPPTELDLHGWNDRLTERVFGDESGMAAFGNRATWFSPRELGRQKAFRKCLLRRRHGEFRGRGSNRQFCFTNLRRRIAAADYRPAVPDGVRRLSEAHAKPDGHDLWSELWHPFLKNSGGWARPRLFSRPSFSLSQPTRCCSRSSSCVEPTANGSSPGATNASSNCASNGTYSSPEGCPTTDGGKRHLTAA